MTPAQYFFLALWFLWPLSLCIVAHLNRPMWEYGKVGGRVARRHRCNGNVQFVIWPKGHTACDFTYPEDWWVNFDESHWPLFEKWEDRNFDQR